MAHPRTQHCFALVLGAICFVLVQSGPAATVSWTGGSGDWNASTNWSGGIVPGPNDDVIIDQPGILSITHSTGTHTNKSLLCQEALTISGGSLTVSNTVQVNNGFTLAGGTLALATILQATNDQPITGSGGSLVGVALAADMNVLNNNSIFIQNGLTLVGGPRIMLSGVLNFAPGTQIIGGFGEITFAGGANTFLQLGVGGATTLTLGTNISIHGRGNIIHSSASTFINQGLIQSDITAGIINISPSIFTNSGILAVESGAVFNITSSTWQNNGTIMAGGSTLTFGGAWTNAGLLTIDNSTLNLGGTFSQASLGNYTRNGGTVNLTGTLNGGLALDTASGSWRIMGTINGGTVSASAGAQLTGIGGTLNGVTLSSDISVPSNNSLYVQNGLTFVNGAKVILSSGGGSVLSLLPGTQTIGGTGEIVFTNGVNNYLQLGFGGATTATLGPNVRVRGGGNITHSTSSTFINQGMIQADVAGQTLTVSPAVFTNNGTMSVLNGAGLTISSSTWLNNGTITVNSSTLTLGGTWSNAGTITATDSTVNLGGTFTQLGLGTFNRSGGTVNLTGTLNGGLALDGTTGTWRISGKISGGSVSASGGAQLIGANGTFSGVMLASDVSVPSNNSLYVENGLTFVNGAKVILNSGGGSGLYMLPGTQTIGGTGEIVFTNGMNNYLQVGFGGPATVTLGPNVIVHGAGNIIHNTSSTFINQGMIQADVAGQTMTVSPAIFTNSGAMAVLNGATLNISSSNWRNDGTITANSSTLTLGGAWTNAGTISATNSTVNLGGTFTQVGLGTFNRSGGTVNFTGTLNGGLVLDAVTGSWRIAGTINGGAVSASGGAQLTGIGGTLSGVTLSSDISVPSNNSLYVQNGLTLMNGAKIILNSGGGCTLSMLPGTQTIGGTGEIVFTNGVNNYLQVGFGGPATVTLGPNVLVRGSGNIIHNSSSTFINQGMIRADVAGQPITVSPAIFTNNGAMAVLNGATLNITSASWRNNGTITANGSTLTMGGVWVNASTISATNSTVNLGGTFTQTTLGTFNRSGGTINLTGTLNGGLALNAVTGSWRISGTINGGSVSAVGGAQLVANGGTFSGVTLASDVTVPSNSSLYVENGLTLLNGVKITLNSGGSSLLNLLPGAQTIGGTGEIVLANGPNNYLQVGFGGPAILTLGPNITVRGSGNIVQSSVSTVVNQGMILADVAGQLLTINVSGFTNAGIVRALSGTLRFTVNTAVTLLPASELGVVIQGPGQSGRIEFQGALNAGGAFDVTTGLNYVQQAGTNYTVLTYASLNGAFASVSGLDLGEGFFFNPVFGPTSLTLTPQTTVRPFVTAQPRSQVAVPGENIVFRVEVGGPGPFSYQWYNNGAPIGGQTSDSLILPSVQLADAGPRQVVIQNGFGSVTSAVATLTVILPPSITTQPASQSVLPGAMVTFTVSADGTGSLHYQWRHNGANILNATNTSYTIASVQVPDGGSYSVVVANEAAAVSSNPAQLVVIVEQLAGGDNFAARVTISGNSGVISSSNTLATIEAGEPNHGGKTGGKSIWYTWKAPADGIARLSLAGSSFDTLLGVYVGNALNALSSRAQDDDNGGFLTSAVQFNVVSQTDYAIAIDGLASVSGTYVLSWQLEASQTLPVITTQPASTVVPNGASAMFSVVSDGTSFQWFLNGTTMAGATSSTLTVPNVGSGQVGNYVVRVTKGTRFVDSAPAALEIGGSSSAFSHSKFEDLFGPGGGGGGHTVLASAPPGFVPVAAGTVESRVFNNRGATTEPGEPIHCGVVGGASKWFGLRPTSDGVLQIDTMGSGIDTLLAVYTGEDLLSLTMITCDDNNAPDGVRSLVRFNAVGGTSYAVVVDGVNGAQGAINLNWRFGRAPVVSTPPVIRNYAPGRNVMLVVELAEPTPDVRFQWQRNGRNLFEGIGSSLILSNLMSSQVGTYSVVVDNFAGIVTNTAALINLASPVDIAIELMDVGPGMNVRLTGPTAQGFVLESTTNFVHWTPMLTNTTPSSLTFTDPSVTNQPRRFYRLTPWP